MTKYDVAKLRREKAMARDNEPNIMDAFGNFALAFEDSAKALSRAGEEGLLGPAPKALAALIPYKPAVNTWTAGGRFGPTNDPELNKAAFEYALQERYNEPSDTRTYKSIRDLWSYFLLGSRMAPSHYGVKQFPRLAKKRWILPRGATDIAAQTLAFSGLDKVFDQGEK